jgi:2'-5' RNA ligase
MIDRFHYGVYLRPDFAMSRAVSDLHRLLRAQYKLHAAGRFMPHATLKGFFRSAADVATIIARLSETLAGWQSFTVYNNGVTRFGPRSIVIGLKHDPHGVPNQELYDLQERVWTAVSPLIHPQCAFTPNDPRGIDGCNPFHPHITLALIDLRPELQAEVLAFIEAGGRVAPMQFTADTCHLLRFRADWQDAWWETLTWELVHSWRAA